MKPVFSAIGDDCAKSVLKLCVESAFPAFGEDRGAYSGAFSVELVLLHRSLVQSVCNPLAGMSFWNKRPISSSLYLHK